MTTAPEFSSGFGATITSGMKWFAKQGQVEIKEGHLGLLRDNGDLINSAPVADVQVKKAALYSMMPSIQIALNGAKYKVNLSYTSNDSTLGAERAKEIQEADNEKFFEVVRELGGQVGKG